MERKPCSDEVGLKRGASTIEGYGRHVKDGLKRGPWTPEEDERLVFILNNGIQCWRTIPELAGLLRSERSCRLRWINYLNPDRGTLPEVEEETGDLLIVASDEAYVEG